MSEKTKYLGIIIDQNLKWNEQIQSLLTKLRRFIHKFYQLRKFMNRKQLIIIYKSLVESILRSGIIVWGGLYDTTLLPLRVIQNHIVKIIFRKPLLYRTALLYNNEILIIRTLYLYLCCIFIYRKPHLRITAAHSHNTRAVSNNSLMTPACQREASQRFVTTVAPKIYNKLPMSIRNIPKLYLFRSKAKQYVIAVLHLPIY